MKASPELMDIVRFGYKFLSGRSLRYLNQKKAFTTAPPLRQVEVVRRNSKDLVCKVMYETFLPEPVQYVVGLPEAEEQQYIGGEHDHRGASADGEKG